MMQIRPFQPNDEADVVALWERVGLTRPWNDPHRDIQRKLTVQPQRRGGTLAPAGGVMIKKVASDSTHAHPTLSKDALRKTPVA